MQSHVPVLLKLSILISSDGMLYVYLAIAAADGAIMMVLFSVIFIGSGLEGY